MQSGSDGFLRPEIKHELCTGCGKCEKSCPVLNPPTLYRNEQPKVYACWHKDEAVRRQSSSGGAFSAIAELILEKNGIIFGAAYDDNLHVHHMGVELADDLDRLRRSKYVQSEIGGTFRQVEEQLWQGRQVLFVGTPCQVAGLYAFLGVENENLLTLDFVCHGVPAPGVFRKYIDWLGQLFKMDVQEFNFRDKRQGWRNITASISLVDGKRKQLKGHQNCFYHGFIDGVTLREACFACAYMKIPRVADFSMADFWGVGDREPFAYADEKERGISLLLINSCRALAWMGSLEERMLLVERTLQEASLRNVHLCQPAKRPMQHKDFLRDAVSRDYAYLERHYMRPTLKRRVVQFVKENFNGALLRGLRNFHKTLGL